MPASRSPPSATAAAAPQSWACRSRRQIRRRRREGCLLGSRRPQAAGGWWAQTGAPCRRRRRRGAPLPGGTAGRFGRFVPRVSDPGGWGATGTACAAAAAARRPTPPASGGQGLQQGTCAVGWGVGTSVGAGGHSVPPRNSVQRHCVTCRPCLKSSYAACWQLPRAGCSRTARGDCCTSHDCDPPPPSLFRDSRMKRDRLCTRLDSSRSFLASTCRRITDARVVVVVVVVVGVGGWGGWGGVCGVCVWGGGGGCKSCFK